VRPYSTVAAVLVSLWTQHNVRWILELVQDCTSNEAKHHFKKLWIMCIHTTDTQTHRHTDKADNESMRIVLL
jgi:hypothetical protein